MIYKIFPLSILAFLSISLSACGGDGNGNRSNIASGTTKESFTLLPMQPATILDKSANYVDIPVQISAAGLPVDQTGKIPTAQLIDQLNAQLDQSLKWSIGNCPEYMSPAIGSCKLRINYTGNTTILMYTGQQTITASKENSTITISEVSFGTGIGIGITLSVQPKTPLSLMFNFGNSIQTVTYKNSDYSYIGKEYFITSDNNAMTVTSPETQSITIEKVSQDPVVYKISANASHPLPNEITIGNLSDTNTISTYAKITKKKDGKPLLSLPLYHGKFSVKDNQLTPAE
ncbi:hypothetical protein [Cysteiniphilum litorale]|uniref:hypothetical protein n=1 Tax=Cysteiniphilum litorale TaxID=2056700 RepID=UPI003F8829B8